MVSSPYLLLGLHLLNLSKELLGDFEACAEMFIPMLRNCKVARALPRIVDLCYTPMQFFVQDAVTELYEDLIKCCVADAMSEVRSTARTLYRMFARTWPERSRRLFMSFDPVIQRLLWIEVPVCLQAHHFTGLLLSQTKPLGTGTERSLESVLHSSKQKVSAIESLLKGLDMSEKSRSSSLDLAQELTRSSSRDPPFLAVPMANSLANALVDAPSGFSKGNNRNGGLVFNSYSARRAPEKLPDRGFVEDNAELREGVAAFSYVRSLLQQGPRGIPEIIQSFEKKPLKVSMERILPHVFSRLIDPKESVRQPCSTTLEIVSKTYGIDSLLPALLRSLDEQRSPKAKLAVLKRKAASKYDPYDVTGTSSEEGYVGASKKSHVFGRYSAGSVDSDGARKWNSCSTPTYMTSSIGHSLSDDTQDFYHGVETGSSSDLPVSKAKDLKLLPLPSESDDYGLIQENNDNCLNTEHIHPSEVTGLVDLEHLATDAGADNESDLGLNHLKLSALKINLTPATGPNLYGNDESSAANKHGALQQLVEAVTKDQSIWSKYFNQIDCRTEVLDDSESSIRELALSLIVEMLRNQRDMEDTIEVSNEVEHCLTTVLSHDPFRCLRVPACGEVFPGRIDVSATFILTLPCLMLLEIRADVRKHFAILGGAEQHTVEIGDNLCKSNIVGARTGIPIDAER
ncbi:hypothetical protein HAX54_041040 [Datura stramonium]|uniref:CLASP N-terminal domain-containing protein n=1 Tax=Datura stramonium TaxID=4076 RepID=A0ABS8VTJ5_DATST|nr:hypothetical protein [Datura stramonium]